MKTNETKKESASEAFRRIEIEIETLNDLLAQGIETLGKKMKAEPKNWNIVGSLATIKEALMNAASFQMGLEPKELQVMMNEVKEMED